MKSIFKKTHALWLSGVALGDVRPLLTILGRGGGMRVGVKVGPLVNGSE